MSDEFKLTSFSQEDFDKYVSDWEHDKKIEEEAHGKEFSPDDYIFDLNPIKLSPSVIVNIREMEYDDKIRFLKFCFQCECISNASIISNLVILAQGRLIEEELYENIDIYFNDDIEFLDVCNDLREEIKGFNTQLVKYFLASLKSMSSLVGDQATAIPNLYYLALASYNLTTISSAMQKVSINYDELPTVLNGGDVVERVCSKNNFVNNFMEDLLKKITDDASSEEV